METNLIFVAGVHGVGKTTFCNRVIANQSNINYLSASRLISDYKKNAFTQSKQVAEISDNQDVLVTAYRSYGHTKPATLLDGHFCLFDELYRPVAIPNDTFSELNVKLIILLTANADTLVRRIEKRDDNKFTQENLLLLQNLESKTARVVSEQLSIPLLSFSEDHLSEDMDVALSKTMEVLSKCEFY